MSKIEEAITRAMERRSTSHSKGDGQGAAPAEPPVKETATTPQDFNRAAPTLTLPDELKQNPMYLTCPNVNAIASEQFGILKDNIIKATKLPGKFKNAIMMTSSIMAEGKTMTSFNLAYSLAKEHDHTVLLIDADLRNPSLSRMLGLSKHKGLTECLSGEVEVRDVLLRSEEEKLAIVPGGSPTRSPAELFSSRRMQQLIHEIKTRYADRYVIIDVPPVLPFAETRTMARTVDGVILVVKENAVSMEAVQKSLGVLEGSEIFGIVYSQANEGAMLPGLNKGYYHEYGYKYGY